MSVVIYVLSGLLVSAGTTAVVMGMQIVHLEQGWTAIISGSVACVGGCVMFGLGAILDSLRALRLDGAAANGADLRVAPDPTADAQQADPVAPAVAVPSGVPVTVEPPRPRVRPAIRPQLPAAPDPAPEAAAKTPEPDGPDILARVEPNLAPEPISSEAEPAPAFSIADGRIVPSARKRPNFLANFLARTTDRVAEDGAAAGERDGSVHPVLTPVSDQIVTRAPTRTSVDLSSGWSEMADDKPQAEFAVAPVRADERGSGAPETAVAANFEEQRRSPAAPAMPPAANLPAAEVLPRPTVVGRYNAGSASYTMYSNGMIEVETEAGTHQFESMQELKAFIERQEKAKA